MNNITFKQFLSTYNFRNFVDNGVNTENEDTQIIRIYPPTGENGVYSNHHEWIEFGVYDFSTDHWKMHIAETFLNERIMNSYIESFHIDDYTSILYIYLTDEKEMDYE